MRAFATFKSLVSHTGRLFSLSLFFFYKIIIDFSPLSYQLRSTRAFFLSHRRKIWHRTIPRAFLSPQITQGSDAARDSSISSGCLLAEHLSLYRSPSLHSLAQHSTAVVRTHTAGVFVDICGYIHSVRRVYFGAPTAKPQTRGLARPNLKPKPTLLPRG